MFVVLPSTVWALGIRKRIHQSNNGLMTNVVPMRCLDHPMINLPVSIFDLKVPEKNNFYLAKPASKILGKEWLGRPVVDLCNVIPWNISYLSGICFCEKVGGLLRGLKSPERILVYEFISISIQYINECKQK